MKKIIISAILTLNLYSDQCTDTVTRIYPLVSTEIDYYKNGLDDSFCANYDITMSLLIAAKNICKTDDKFYELLNRYVNELTKPKYKNICKNK